MLKNGLMLLSLILISESSVASAEWLPLYDRVDTDLQAELQARLDVNPAWARLIKRKKMAIGVVDLSADPPRYARVNGNHMMYAASLPKIAILLAVYASFEDGTLQESESIRRDLDDMIRVSSNAAATRLIDLVRLAKIQAVLRDPKYGLYDQKRGGGLWVGKRYARSGNRVGDPMHNISHGATVTQVCRFFYLLNAGRLVNARRSKQMLEHLVDPRLHHKFVSQIDERAPNARVYRKSGTWKQWHADAVMVEGTRWRDYILVGLVESSDGESILRQVLPAVEEIIVPAAYAGGFDDR